jgi:hypothetical protein
VTLKRIEVVTGTFDQQSPSQFSGRAALLKESPGFF